MRIHLYSQQFKYRFLPIFLFGSRSLARSLYLYTVAIGTQLSLSIFLSMVLHDVRLSVLKLFRMGFVTRAFILSRAIAKKRVPKHRKYHSRLDSIHTYISFDYFACHKVLFLFAGAISFDASAFLQ